MRSRWGKGCVSRAADLRIRAAGKRLQPLPGLIRLTKNVMKILVRTPQKSKRLLGEMTSEVGPSGKVKAHLKRFRPPEAPCCRSRDSLHGHGWRSRSWTRRWWGRWGCLWYWRVHCTACGATLMIVFDLNWPRLIYAAGVVVDVIVGRLKGLPARAFTPHRTTQRRWLDRFLHWFPVAQAAGMVAEALELVTQTASRLREVVARCADEGLLLYAPVPHGYRDGGMGQIAL